MRLSLRIDDDVYAVALSLAHSEHISLAKAINQLARRGFQKPTMEPVVRYLATDFPVSAGRQLITQEDVKKIESDESLLGKP
jgi:hypothetical protein